MPKPNPFFAHANELYASDFVLMFSLSSGCAPQNSARIVQKKHKETTTFAYKNPKDNFSMYAPLFNNRDSCVA